MCGWYNGLLNFIVYFVEEFKVGAKGALILSVVIFDSTEGSAVSIVVEKLENLKIPANCFNSSELKVQGVWNITKQEYDKQNEELVETVNKGSVLKINNLLLKN